jgi:threonylcarbamoyladenosine tRNA methylthiotransferase MtaB
MDPMKHFKVITLGCKVNQCESAALESLLEASGLKMARPTDKNDLIVVNTCTVTGRAAMQSRQAVRQAVRSHPGATIVVTGCYAQTAPEELRRIGGVALVVGQGDKLKIPELVDRAGSESSRAALVHRDILKSPCFDPLPAMAPENRTRAFLKIQDGCNTFCTYCIVPYARGRSRSMPLEDVFDHLSHLAQKGFREVVLTGIHLGAYGRDLKPRTTLNALLESICDGRYPPRIRLSSIEPTELNAELISLTADPQSPLCPHFHIPLQSGDDGVLQRMGRPYNRDQFAGVIGAIARRLPEAAIGADVLVGFPGEDEPAFNRTVELIERLPVSYLHVFPYSPRQGTAAARFKDKVHEAVVKERCRQLRRLGEEKKESFYRSNIGRSVAVLVENAGAGECSGISENYIPVRVAGARQSENAILKVRIDKVAQDLTAIGRLID